MAALLIGGIIVSFLPYGLAWSWLLLIPGIVLTVGYFLFGTLSSASQKMQFGDYKGAEEQLKWTWKPNWMLKMNRGVYHFLLGTIRMQDRQLDAAEVHMQDALEVGMPTGDYTAQVYLALSNIAASKSKLQPAKNYLKQAKECEITEPQLKEAIKQYEKQFKMIPRGGQRFQNPKQMRRPKRPR